MELYTLDSTFKRAEIIDEFLSVIWTERYTKNGDVTMVVPDTPEMVAKLPTNGLLSLQGSKEVMLIDTALRDKGTLKITGKTLTKFLDERIIRTTGAHEEKNWTLPGKPGAIIAAIVREHLTPGGSFLDEAIGIHPSLEIIPSMSVVSGTLSGPDITVAVPFGPMYTALEQIAEAYLIGFRLILDAADTYTYSLVFETYAGKDLTSSQNIYPIVRFSPAMDSLTDVSELQSIAGYKTVAYAFATTNPDKLATLGPGYAAVDDLAATANGFDRRAIMVYVDDLTSEAIGGIPAVPAVPATETDPEIPEVPAVPGSVEILYAILHQRARDALANNNYTKIIDGEIVPQSEYQYGIHYGLGDIIELGNNHGLNQKARITEYIRTQDQTGERSYPTVSVID